MVPSKLLLVLLTELRMRFVEDSSVPTNYSFGACQRQVLRNLCHLAWEQIEALERSLNALHWHLVGYLTPTSEAGRAAIAVARTPHDTSWAQARGRLAARAIAVIDDALHKGFKEHYGDDSTHGYVPRVSCSPKSAFMDVVNLCYDAVGFGSVSPEGAIHGYLTRVRIVDPGNAHVSSRRDHQPTVGCA